MRPRRLVSASGRPLNFTVRTLRVTPDSLNKAMRRYQSILYVAMLPFIPLMIFNGSIARWLADHLALLGLNIKWATLGLILIGIWIAGLFGSILAVQSRLWPKCPSCYKRITPSNVGIVIATKHCPMCGDLIVRQGS
jgi:predicted RNA-binding Zn-ribbon protein involved in translation (DUF1610 family)